MATPAALHARDVAYARERRALERAPRRPRSDAVLEFSARYLDDVHGAGELAAAVAGAARKWGIWWSAPRVERLAFAQASWLLRNRPHGGFLALHASYDPECMWLSVCVGDSGAVLPVPDRGEQWRLSIGARVRTDAELGEREGRTLRCQFKIRAPWRTRLTWDCALVQGVHPEHTFEDHYTDTDARCGLHSARARIGVAGGPGPLTAVHWQGPEDRDEIWHDAESESTTLCAPGHGARPA